MRREEFMYIVEFVPIQVASPVHHVNALAFVSKVRVLRTEIVLSFLIDAQSKQIFANFEEFVRFIEQRLSRLCVSQVQIEEPEILGNLEQVPTFLGILSEQFRQRQPQQRCSGYV